MFTLSQPLAFLPSSVWWLINGGVVLLLSFFVILPSTRRDFLAEKNNSLRQKIWLSLTLFLSILWLLKAQLLDNLCLHLIGASMAYLLLGFPLASLALAVVLIFTDLTRHVPIEIFGTQYILTVLIPLLLSVACHYSMALVLPKRLFAFIFLHGFFIAGIVMIATVILNLYFLNYTQLISLDVGNQVFWISPILMGWAEAFLSGMFTALIAVYHPNWWYVDKQFIDV